VSLSAQHLFVYLIQRHKVEKLTPSTGHVKGDVVAFLVKNKMVTPLFVQLSGGIDCNNGLEKAASDEKMLRQIIQLLKLYYQNKF
jgi:hypothetical protein